MTTYYKRRRPMPILLGYEDRADGSQAPVLTDPVSAMTTRYYWRKNRRADARRPWGNVYYVGGAFYRSVNCPTIHADGTRRDHVNALAPVSGKLYNRHMAQTVEQGKAAPILWLTCEQGRAVSGTGADGQEWIAADDTADWVEDLLDLAPGNRPAKAA